MKMKVWNNLYLEMTEYILGASSSSADFCFRNSLAFFCSSTCSELMVNLRGCDGSFFNSVGSVTLSRSFFFESSLHNKQN